MNARLTLPMARTERRQLFLLLKLFAYRARYLQLFHACPNAGEGNAVRNKWNRKMRWSERRIVELSRALGRSA